MGLIEKGIQVLIALFEVWLCYQVLYFSVIEKQYLTKREKVIVLFNIVVVGMMLTVNRNIVFFSDIMFCVSVFVTVICVWLVKRTELLLILGVVTLYYSGIALIDFLFAFVSILFLKEEFYRAVFVHPNSFWIEMIFIGTRILAAVIVVLLQKKKEISVVVRKCQYVVLAIDATFCMILKRYQFKLYDMAMGTIVMNGVDAAVSLLILVIIIGFGTLILLKYQKIKEENKFLLLQEKMSEQYYQDASDLLEKNHQLIHDIKNHFIIMREYAEKGENEEICQYMDEIASRLFQESINKWTGNKTLDIVLNQKKNLAEYKNIDFYIKVSVIPNLMFSDSEICSLFGNLLDNAIEACEKMGEEEKWIIVKINRKDKVLFIEISNSMNKEPIMKHGKPCSDKSNYNVHGYGLKNVEGIVEKYEGNIFYEVEKRQFRVRITFFDMDVSI